MKTKLITIEFIIETELGTDFLEEFVKTAMEREIPRAEKIDIRIYTA